MSLIHNYPQILGCKRTDDGYVDSLSMVFIYLLPSECNIFPEEKTTVIIRTIFLVGCRNLPFDSILLQCLYRYFTRTYSTAKRTRKGKKKKAPKVQDRRHHKTTSTHGLFIASTFAWTSLRSGCQLSVFLCRCPRSTRLSGYPICLNWGDFRLLCIVTCTGTDCSGMAVLRQPQDNHTLVGYSSNMHERQPLGYTSCRRLGHAFLMHRVSYCYSRNIFASGKALYYHDVRRSIILIH